MNEPRTKQASKLVAGLLVGAAGLLATDGVSAQVPWAFQFDEPVSYACKMVCGARNDDTTQVVKGLYASTCNIHNPHDIAVVFEKKFVVANPQDKPRGPISPFEQEGLEPDQAVGVDCNDVKKLYDPKLGGYKEGFLVVRPLPTGPSGAFPRLDVWAVYTARPRIVDPEFGDIGEVSTIDVEEVEPRPYFRELLLQ